MSWHICLGINSKDTFSLFVDEMPKLFNTKEEAEKEAHKFGYEGAYQIGDKWMPCSMHKHNH